MRVHSYVILPDKFLRKLLEIKTDLELELLLRLTLFRTYIFCEQIKKSLVLFCYIAMCAGGL